MSFEREKQVGQLLDQALGEHLDLYFQPAWHPQHHLSRRRARWKAVGLSTAAVAAVFLALPFFVQPSSGQRQVSNSTLSAIHLPKSLYRQVSRVSHGSFSVASMVPVYGTYPMASPTGHNLRVDGSFQIQGQTGSTLSIRLNNRMQVKGGMLFQNGVPVYLFSGSSFGAGSVIKAPTAHSVKPVGHAKPQWYPGGNVGIGSFSAAGSHVYVSHGNLWSDVSPGSSGVWMQSPTSPGATTQDSIAGLPVSPNDALLMEQSPSGLSQGFITKNGGSTWQSWGRGSQSVSTLIAIDNRYWAVINGTLAWSSNGSQWHNILTLNPRRWQVETYAIDPANPKVAAVSLIPISGDGIGPVLETHNGGANWSKVPNFPAMGEAPSTMVMSTQGNIAALINANGPVLVRYTAMSQQWSVLPVPVARAGTGGLGQMAASGNGNLIYGAPSGKIYQWIRSSRQWLVINPPPGLDGANVSASPLQAIGTNQILAGYPNGWAYFWEPSKEAQFGTVKKSHKVRPAAGVAHVSRSAH